MQKSTGEEGGITQLELPKRPILEKAPKGHKVLLATNSYSLHLKTSNFIYVYDAKFTEDVPADNTPLKRCIIKGIKEDLEKVLKLYIFAGSLLYSPTDAGATLPSFYFTLKEQKYKIDLSRVHMISVQDILFANKSPAKAQTVSTFLNLIVKNLLSACNMLPIGRTGKYMLPTGAKIIPESKIEVWPGYYTSVNLHEAGLLLEVDYASRILRQETVYDFLKKISASSGAENYAEKMKEELSGKVVLARYGNKQTYTITDIDFTMSPTSYEFDTAEGKVNLEFYLKKKYMISLKDKKQPLLLSIRKQRDGVERKIYLVPELCSMTGLPDELMEDRNAMKLLAVHTKLSPEQRMKEIQKLLKSFMAGDQKPGSPHTVSFPEAHKIMQAWNLQIDLSPKEVEGSVLLPQEIGLNGTKSMKVNENGQFFFKEFITSPLALEKWILVHTEKDRSLAENFVETMYTAAKTFGIAVEYPTYISISGIRAKNFIDAVKSKMTEKNPPQIIMFLLPPPSVNEYAEIKKFAVSRNPPVLTQMVKTRTINGGKGLMAVCSKIALQINAKRNGELWRVKIPASFPRKTMVVGIDISKEAGLICVGFSSSYDPYYSHYFTQVTLLKKQEQAASVLGLSLVKALQKFLQETKKFLPELIVIYRDGLTEMQRTSMFMAELQQMTNALRLGFPDYSPKMIYATLNKKIHTRFFTIAGDSSSSYKKANISEGSGLSNPRPGTIVHSGIVNPNKYEFLFMPQFVNEGTGTPSRIQVLYDTSGLGIEVFEELTNALCYGYYNWQGAIRTPAPCKYALAHAKLVTKYTKKAPADQLLPFLYFL